MPNDLISRTSALKAIRALCDTTDCNIAIMPDVAEVLGELPAVDAEPAEQMAAARAELITALERLKVETGSLACLGCGYEHSCSTHGCAIIREAVALVKVKTDNGAAQ